MALLELLEALARAANEAASPEAALRACLEQICAYGRWTLGHVALYAPGHSSGVAQTSLWHALDPGPFEDFIRQSNDFAFNLRRGGFVGEALTDRKPVWVEDLAQKASFGRMAALKKGGLRAGFVFPVVVGGAIAAFLEFFAAETRPPDQRLLEAIGAVAGQLARLIERRRAEDEHARLAAIVEFSEDAIFSTTPERTVITWNASAERMFGYTAAEAVGRDVAFLVPDDLRHEIGERRAHALTGHAARPHDTERLTKDGRRVAVSISASPVRDAAGNVSGIALIYRDITERKRVQLEVGRNARIAQLMESLARAATEANTPQAAMRDCVERICRYGDWTLGRVALLSDPASKVPVSSLWHGASDERYAEFTRASDTFDLARPAGIFISHMLRTREPIWVEDLRAAPLSGRLISGTKAGLRSGFAFPITVQGEIVAFLEFFAENTRPPDDALLAVIGNLGGQLARLIERARALDAVRDSEERFRAAFEQAGVGMGLRSADPRHPRWLRVNQKLCDIFGYTREELLQLTTVDLTPAAERGLATGYNEQLMRGEITAYTREKRYVRKDGTLIWTSIALSAVRGPDARPTHIVSVVTDISDRKRAEAAQARLAAIVENSDDAIVSRGLDRNILTWNAAAERLFGWSAAEAIGRSISILVPPERRGENATYREKVHRGEPVLAYDTERLNKDGQRIDVSLSQSPIKDADGRIVAVSLIFRDITERKEAEEKIRYLAHYDSLTGLPNRALFYDRLGQAIALARRDEYSVALLYLDLDGFKAVNDTLGHDAGDELLKAVAERIKSRVRESDTIARVGGDEFIAILPKIANHRDCAVVANKILEVLAAPYHLGADRREAAMGASIGIAAFPANAEDIESLIKAADSAMYFAKQAGNRFSFFDELPQT